jgi:hypothetical protein
MGLMIVAALLAITNNQQRENHMSKLLSALLAFMGLSAFAASQPNPSDFSLKISVLSFNRHLSEADNSITNCKDTSYLGEKSSQCATLALSNYDRELQLKIGNMLYDVRCQHCGNPRKGIISIGEFKGRWKIKDVELEILYPDEKRGFRIEAYRVLSARAIPAQQVGQDSAGTSPVPSAETLNIGVVELHLGMSKAEVFSRITNKGYIFGTGEDGNVPILEEHGDLKMRSLLGLVSFENNRLTFINRVWTPDEQDGPAIARGVYGALSEAQRQGRTACTVSTDSSQGPSGDVKYILFACGQSPKVISLMLTHYQGQDSVSVGEILRSK